MVRLLLTGRQRPGHLRPLIRLCAACPALAWASPVWPARIPGDATPAGPDRPLRAAARRLVGPDAADRAHGGGPPLRGGQLQTTGPVPSSGSTRPHRPPSTGCLPRMPLMSSTAGMASTSGRAPNRGTSGPARSTARGRTRRPTAAARAQYSQGQYSQGQYSQPQYGGAGRAALVRSVAAVQPAWIRPGGGWPGRAARAADVAPA